MPSSQALKFTNEDHPDYKLLQKALTLVKNVNKKNNDAMGEFIKTKRKIVLNELWSKEVNLMLPHRQLIEEYKDFYVLDFDNCQRRQWLVGLFTDCMVIFSTGGFARQEKYDTHLMFNELSYAVEMEDMKFYNNIVKVGLPRLNHIGGWKRFKSHAHGKW